MNNLFKELHTKVTDSSLHLSDYFYEGNEVSQKMGRILKSMINVLKDGDSKFDKMRSELESVYSKMSNIHNRHYQDLGGKLGSGEIIEKEIDEVESKDIVKIMEGISDRGLMTLQLSIKGLQRLLESPFPDSNRFADRVQFAHWITLLSMYDETHTNEVIKIVTKYDKNIS